MKQKITNQEILLFAGTRFASRELCSRETDKESGKESSTVEQLEKACWGGLLCELLPELAGCHAAKDKNFIWHIMSGEHFVRISMGPNPQTMANETSIDPYFFLLTIFYN